MPKGVYERTERHRAAIREGQRHRKPISEETRAKLSAAQAQVEHTPEWNARVSAAKMGNPVPALRKPNLKLRKIEPKYRAAHARVSKARGRAADLMCACGAKAQHWSFSWRRVPEELWLWAEGKRPYTAEPDDYDPRCAPCATRYDSAGYSVKSNAEVRARR